MGPKRIIRTTVHYGVRQKRIMGGKPTEWPGVNETYKLSAFEFWDFRKLNSFSICELCHKQIRWQWSYSMNTSGKRGWNDTIPFFNIDLNASRDISVMLWIHWIWRLEFLEFRLFLNCDILNFKEIIVTDIWIKSFSHISHL